MTDEPEEPARRGRPPRAKDILEGRVRREKIGEGAITGLRLTVREEILDRNNFEYRWLNDRPGRIQSMHDRDWDIVSVNGDEIPQDQLGTAMSHHVGIGEGNRPVSGYLARKPKQWYQEAQREKQKQLDETDQAIQRGTFHKSSTEAAAIAGERGYVPDGSISIRDDRRK